MKFKDALFSAIGIIGLIAGLFAGTQAAQATQTAPILSPTDQAQLTEFFDKFNVSSVERASLMHAFYTGKTWQSMDGSSNPTSTETTTSNGVEWTVERFDDGSVRASGIGSNSTSGSVTVRGVNNCGYSAGKTGNFQSCYIYYWVGLVSSGFYANFTINASGYDKITSVWGGSFTAGGACSASVPAPSIVKGTESATGKAVAGYTPVATMCGLPYTTSFPSYLHVGGNQATHVYS